MTSTIPTFSTARIATELQPTRRNQRGETCSPRSDLLLVSFTMKASTIGRKSPCRYWLLMIAPIGFNPGSITTIAPIARIAVKMP